VTISYRDVKIIILNYSGKELDEFFEHANSIHPSIKFTHEVSKTKISFLDTTTTVKEGNMTTDLYSKPVFSLARFYRAQRLPLSE
jgi:hypothetical protein